MKFSVYENGRSVLRILVLVTSVLLSPLAADAQDAPEHRTMPSERQLYKPHTQAEFGIGMLTLPTTDICLTAPDTCTKGDTSPDAYVWTLYRANEKFAIGAGVNLALPSGEDAPQQSAAGINRTHTRRYLLIDAVARYYALHLDWLEGWVGVTGGGVVINDQYQNKTAANPSAPPLLGPTGIAVGTEGLSAGLAAGMGWAFAMNWSLEGSIRSAWWVLPSHKACAPTGDCATLSGAVAMFSLGIGIAYRISL